MRMFKHKSDNDNYSDKKDEDREKSDCGNHSAKSVDFAELEKIKSRIQYNHEYCLRKTVELRLLKKRLTQLQTLNE